MLRVEGVDNKQAAKAGTLTGPYRGYYIYIYIYIYIYRGYIGE